MLRTREVRNSQHRQTGPGRNALHPMLFGNNGKCPSRSCLLTGTHSGHTAIRGNVELDPEGQFPLPADAQTIFHDFQNAGYKTGAFVNGDWEFIGSTGDPKKQGIDEFYGYNCQLLAHSYYPDHLWDNDKRRIKRQHTGCAVWQRYLLTRPNPLKGTRLP